MKNRIILCTILMLFLSGMSYASRFNYTWIDADGTLNVTDYPPPGNAEIIDISAIPSPPKKQVDVLSADEMKQKKLLKQSQEKKRLMAQAEKLRDQEAELRQQASRLIDEAKEQRRLSKLNRYKGKYRRRASNKEQEAQDLIAQADSLALKAENLERKASQMK